MVSNLPIDIGELGIGELGAFFCLCGKIRCHRGTRIIGKYMLYCPGGLLAYTEEPALPISLAQNAQPKNRTGCSPHHSPIRAD